VFGPSLTSLFLGTDVGIWASASRLRIFVDRKRRVTRNFFSAALGTAFCLLIWEGSILARTGSHCVGVDLTVPEFISISKSIFPYVSSTRDQFPAPQRTNTITPSKSVAPAPPPPPPPHSLPFFLRVVSWNVQRKTHTKIMNQIVVTVIRSYVVRY